MKTQDIWIQFILYLCSSLCHRYTILPSSEAQYSIRQYIHVVVLLVNICQFDVAKYAAFLYLKKKDSNCFIEGKTVTMWA